MLGIQEKGSPKRAQCEKLILTCYFLSSLRRRPAKPNMPALSRVRVAGSGVGLFTVKPPIRTSAPSAGPLKPVIPMTSVDPVHEIATLAVPVPVPCVERQDAPNVASDEPWQSV